MATKGHRRSHQRRLRRLVKKLASGWLLVMLTRSLLTIVVALVLRWLGVQTSCGGR